jgi:16S rRNA (uracil1498-N3)-methyltransferase
MGRELRRLLIVPERIAALASQGSGGARLPLEPQECHYLERVLRFRPGDRLAVVDGCGGLWSAVLEADRRLRFEQEPAAPLIRQEPLSPVLELAMAVPKREADLVWRMATELGADVLQPLIASRSAPGERCPLQRWEGIVREATEQCERLWRPVLMPPQPAADWLGQPAAGIALLATTRREGLPLCSRVLEDLSAGGTEGGFGEGVGHGFSREAGSGTSSGVGSGVISGITSAIRLAIGPEGGWTTEEEERAQAAGWRPVSLGESILRTATAAVSGLALLADRRAVSCASSRRPCP